jgi:hypothetical protein
MGYYRAGDLLNSRTARMFELYEWTSGTRFRVVTAACASLRQRYLSAAPVRWISIRLSKSVSPLLE